MGTGTAGGPCHGDSGEGAFVLPAPPSRGGTPQVLAYTEAVCISGLSSGLQSWEVQQQLLPWAQAGR